MMLKITAICFFFLNGLIVRFDGVVKCAPPLFGPSTKKVTKKGRHYDPNHGFEPYWPGGDWVFYGDPSKPSTEPAPEICGDECHYLYQEVGEVCGRTVTNLEYSGCSPAFYWWCYGDIHNDYSKGYKTFDSYCEFLDSSCKSADGSKPPFNKWIFVHKGPCIDDHNATYYKPMYLAEDPVSRLQFYIKSVGDTFAELGREPC